MSESSYTEVSLSPEAIDLELGSEIVEEVQSNDRSEKINELNYTCQICRELNPSCGHHKLSCNHLFCKECLSGYLTSKINDGCVLLKCCYVTDEIKDPSTDIENQSTTFKICDSEIHGFDIHQILAGETATLEKYERFKYIKENKNARQCPHCSVFNLCENPSTEPQINCKNCFKSYCFCHSNAHDFSKFPSCAEYEQSIAAEVKENVEFIAGNSKPCPGCGLAVMKSGGCNHMKCQCGVAFCWLCGKQVEDSLFPAHFQWWNPTGCSNLQLDEAIQPSVTRRVCARLLSILQILVLGPLTLVSTIASSLLCFSCIYVKLKSDPTLSLVCGQNNLFANCMSSWGVFWMLILFILPLVVAFGSVAVGVGLACMIIVYPCYFIIRVSNGKYPWPDIVTRSSARLWRVFTNCCGCGVNNTATSHSPLSTENTTAAVDSETTFTVQNADEARDVELAIQNSLADLRNSIAAAAATPAVSPAIPTTIQQDTVSGTEIPDPDLDTPNYELLEQAFTSVLAQTNDEQQKLVLQECIKNCQTNQASQVMITQLQSMVGKDLEEVRAAREIHSALTNRVNDLIKGLEEKNSVDYGSVENSGDNTNVNNSSDVTSGNVGDIVVANTSGEIVSGNYTGGV